MKSIKTIGLFLAAMLLYAVARPQAAPPRFRVLAFYTAKQDPAHISFVHEANRWFTAAALRGHFRYDSTDNAGITP